MKLIKMEKVRDGKYLKNYELTYENKAGKEKKYEIVSRRELSSVEDIGKRASGLSIAAISEGKLLLLKEFRMGVNKTIYNLCAGMLEGNETLEECAARMHELIRAAHDAPIRNKELIENMREELEAIC